MFDGFKIECRKTPAAKWLNNPLIKFPLIVDRTTGAEAANTTTKYKSLKFDIHCSDPDRVNKRCFVSGSVHKYWNGNGSNANDFKLSNVIDTVKNLCSKFDISVDEKLINVELGVNVELPITAKEFISRIISMPQRRLIEMNAEMPEFGRECHTDEYNIKVYDKGMQQNIKAKNLLRFEIKVNKLRFLRAYGIKTLADLCDPNKVIGLGNLLYKMFLEIIYFDTPENLDELPDKTQVEILKMSNPRYWTSLDKDRRYKLRKKYEILLSETESYKVRNEAAQAIIDKWQKLVDIPVTEKNLPTATPKNRLQRLAATIPYVDKRGKHRCCEVCGKDISDKRAGAKYCSKLCRHKASSNFRRERVRLQRIEETKHLKLLKRKKSRASINFCRLFDTAGNMVVVDLQNIIMHPAQSRKITRIEIIQFDNIVITLNTIRAKKFLRHTTGLNLNRKL